MYSNYLVQYNAQHINSWGLVMPQDIRHLGQQWWGNGLQLIGSKTWWCHQMETFSKLLAFCVGNSPVNSLHKGQRCGALMFFFICAWTHSWANNGDDGDLRCHCAHDVIVMTSQKTMRTYCQLDPSELISYSKYQAYLQRSALENVANEIEDICSGHNEWIMYKSLLSMWEWNSACTDEFNSSTITVIRLRIKLTS